nr:uncharacterized protein LOC107395497 [Nothobranchius furzeri]
MLIDMDLLHVLEKDSTGSPDVLSPDVQHKKVVQPEGKPVSSGKDKSVVNMQGQATMIQKPPATTTAPIKEQVIMPSDDHEWPTLAESLKTSHIHPKGSRGTLMSRHQKYLKDCSVVLQKLKLKTDDASVPSPAPNGKTYAAAVQDRRSVSHTDVTKDQLCCHSQEHLKDCSEVLHHLQMNDKYSVPSPVPKDKTNADDLKDQGPVDLGDATKQQECKETSVQPEKFHDAPGAAASSATIASSSSNQESLNTFHSIVKGSFHQGHKRFGCNRFKQCAPNSITAIMTNTVKMASTWSRKDINNILISGDSLYTYMKEQNMISDAEGSGYVFVQELPTEHTFHHHKFSLEYMQTFTGHLIQQIYHEDVSDFAMPLDVALQRAIFDNDGCLFTISRNTCAVLKEQSQFSVFDPHSRGHDGLWQLNGTSIVAHFDTLDQVYTHLINLSHSLCADNANEEDTAFEMTGVKVTAQSMSKPIQRKTASCQNDVELISGNDDSFDDDTFDQLVLEEIEHVAVSDTSESLFESPSRCELIHMQNRSFQDDAESICTSFDDDSFDKVVLQEIDEIAVNDTTSLDVDSVTENHHTSLDQAIIEEVPQNDTSVFIVSENINSTVTFNPLTSKDKRNFCSQLQIVPSLERVKSLWESITLDEPLPCTTIHIQPDGNCFFRALAFVITGNEELHRSIRRAVVNQILQNSDLYSSYIRQEFESVQQYVTQTGIRKVGSWATEIEIQAAADFFHTHIYTYTQGKWLQYGSSSTLDNTKGIYLKHCNECHYEPIACVKAKTNTCFNLISCSYCHFKGDKDILSPSKISRENRRKRTLYNEDIEKRESKIFMLQKLYKDNPKYRLHKKQLSVITYRNKPDLRARLRHDSKENYRNKPELRARLRLANKQNYYKKPELRARLRHDSKENYRNKPELRARLRLANKQNYYKKPELRARLRHDSKENYRNKPELRARLRLANKQNYYKKPELRARLRHDSKENYRNKPELRARLRLANKQNYNDKPELKARLKLASKTTYATKSRHSKLQLLKQNVERYRNKIDHRNRIKQSNSERYRNVTAYADSVKEHGKRRRQNLMTRKKFIDNVIQLFREKVKFGPQFVCCVCHRLLFKHQVLECKTQQYEIRGSFISSVAKKCITDTYLHKCGQSSDSKCHLEVSPACKLWVCFTCHRKMLNGKVPEESVANNMHLDSIPVELSTLNPLEQHLVAQHIPFMKLLALPKGGQNGVHGPVTCVPSNTETVSNILPRLDDQNLMIKVKLKRKLTYKGHYDYQYVNALKVHNAIAYLKSHNTFYKDVQFNSAWTNPLEKESEDSISETDNVTLEEDGNRAEIECEHLGKRDGSGTEVESEDLVSDDHFNDRQQHGMFLDTCMQPVDIAQEILDNHFDSVLSVAPAEGNTPVRLLTDTSNEAKCFPVLFPNGTGTFHDAREQRITLSKYLNTRILNADGRFGKNLDYIFYAQYLSEVNQVVSNVSIALRKGYHGLDNTNITSSMLGNTYFLKNVLNADMGYKFLKPIRGTPVFWQGVQKDLFAYVRQLGIPTWFASFSSADLRWPEFMEAFMAIENIQGNIHDMDWAQKCDLLKNNPVTAARMFDYRFRSFLKDVIMSPAQPIGKIIDYFYRVEFQQRGSCHTHCLFWTDGPKIGVNTDAEVIAFVDKYVTCDLPPDSDPLHEVVHSVQMHSKKHSKSCRKNHTTCRFHFPRPPSNNTFICKQETDVDNKENPSDKTSSDLKKAAKHIMTKVKEALTSENNTFNSIDDLFNSIGIDQTTFETVYKLTSSKTTVVHKRNINDIWVNQYNTDLLRCWNANMDIQFVCDAYACIVYIISYISKAEREMGLLLKHAQNEIKHNENLDAKQALNKLGNVFLHNREVSAQESVYRVTNMRLKEGSRKVTFVPTGDNIVRMSLPLNVIQNSANGNQIWMTNITDRYKSRPKSSEFMDMCIATFASEYRNVPNSEKSRPEVVSLLNNNGCVRKRTRTNVAVVRNARFSKEQDPEKHYQSQLQLFLPYYTENQLKPSQFTTFQEFYETGSITNSSKNIQSVKDVVEFNRSKFEIKAEDLQNIQEDIEHFGFQEDVWAELCPEAELDRLECLEDRSLDNNPNTGEQEVIPDLEPITKPALSFHIQKQIVSHKEAQSLMRSLNQQQSNVFYKIRQWCLDKVNGHNPSPFYVFISGGAGTGKSHLVKAVSYETTRILSRLSNYPEYIHVLLTAPTGVAALNINATTIHNSFAIGNNISLPYQPLREEKINTLRATLKHLQILIIDEISMVDNKLLTYIHGRLRQIKQCSDFSSFGNVSVIAVGDFYQLPPVKGTPLYKDPIGSNLWQNSFSHVELTDILRQKNKDFAVTLNRLRKHKKDQPLHPQDEALLKRCETGMGEDTEILHLFATNSDVDNHNFNMLHKQCTDIVQIKAQDFHKNPQTGRTTRIPSTLDFGKKTYLDKLLSIAPKARVMLIKNIDVSDGLVNGVFGTVCRIQFLSNNSFPHIIYVNFDNPSIGQQLRHKFPTSDTDLTNATPISPDEDKLEKGVRRQFPLRLAWSCTIHKVQGLTLQKAVVSFKRIFSAGQAYVALSRVTSLEHLTIQDFKAKAIYARSDVEENLKLMPNFIDTPVSVPNCTFKVCLHNVQGLKNHIQDVKSNQKLLTADIICLTETWLKETHPPESISLPGWTFHHKTRSDSYDETGLFSTFRSKNGGGVGFYHKNSIMCKSMAFNCNNLEALLFSTQTLNHHYMLLYKPPSYNLQKFKDNLKPVLHYFNECPGTKIVMGDMNDDALVSNSFVSFMKLQGYTQIVTSPTTENNTLIDHVYIKDIDPKTVHVEVIPTYYSYHECIQISFLTRTDTDIQLQELGTDRQGLQDKLPQGERQTITDRWTGGHQS